MNLLMTLFAIILLFSLGYCLLEVFFNEKRRTFLAKLGISYGVGAGIISLYMFSLSVLGIKWNIVYLILPVILSFIAYFIKNKELLRIRINKPNLGRRDKLLVSLILITVIYVFFEASLRPLPSWDGWSSFYLEGKAFFLGDFVSPDIAKYSGTSIPPLVPLLIAFVYKIIGYPDDKSSLLIFTFYYVSLLVVFFHALTARIGRTYSLLFTFILCSVPNLIRHAGNVDVGHADLIVSYYFFSSSVLLLDYFKNKSVKTLILLQFFLAFGAFVKDEGLPFFLVCEIIILVYILVKKMYSKFVYQIIGIGLVLLWTIYKIYSRIPTNPFFDNVPQLGRFSGIIIAITKEFLNFQRWEIIWLLGTIVLLIKKPTDEIRYILILFLLQLSVYIGIYFTTPREPIAHIEGSFDRLLLQILPIFLFLTAISFRQLVLHKKRLH